MRIGLVVAGVVALAMPCGAVPVSGTVVRGDGSPAIAARVQFLPEVLPFGYDDQRAPEVAETDRAGRFQRDMPAGGYRLTIAGWRQATAVPVEVVEGQPLAVRLGVDWPWPSPPTARGSVLLLDANGKPAAGRSVWIGATGTGDGLNPCGGCQCDASPLLPFAGYDERRTDAEGRARFAVQAGLQTLAVWAGGNEALKSLVARPGEQLPELTVRLPESPVEFPGWRPLVQPFTRVQVYGPGGKPLANRWLRARALDGEHSSACAVRTDSSGLADVPSWGGPARWVLKTQGLAESRARHLAMRRGAPVVRFDLTAPSQSVRGTVRDEQGQALANCWVVACPPGSRTWNPRPLEERDDCTGHATTWYGQDEMEMAGRRLPELAGITVGVSTFTRTGADGTYRLDNLDPGRWHVVFAKRGYVADEARAVALGGQVDFVLRANGGGLSGIVRGPDGQPWRDRAIELSISGGDTRALHGTGWSRLAVTNGEGRYTVAADSLPAGACEVEIRSGYRVKAKRRVALSHRVPVELDLALPAEPVVSGRVLLPDGRPAAQAWVCTSDSPRERTVWTDAEGRFSLPAQSSGGSGLLIFAEGCARAELSALCDQPVEVRLKPGASLVGHLRWPKDKTYRAGQAVVAHTGLGGDYAWAPLTMYPTGAFGLTCLAPGAVSLWFDMHDDLRARGEATVPSAEPVTIQAERIGTGDIRGVVLGPDGRPMQGASVVAESTEQAEEDERGTPTPPHRQTAGADGRFHFRGLRAVTWEVTASAPGLAPDRAHVEAGDDILGGISLRLRWLWRGRLSGVPAGCQSSVVFAEPSGSTEWNSPWTEPYGPVETVSVPLAVGPGEYGATAQPGPWHAYATVRAEDVTAGTTEWTWDLGAVTLRPGQRAPDLVLPDQRGALRVQVPRPAARATGAIPNWVWLRELATRRTMGHGVVFDQDVLTWPCAPPGEYVLAWQAEGQATRQVPFSIVAGQTAEIAATACQGVPVTITGGTESSSLMLVNETTYAAATVDEGVATIRGVPPGVYDVWYGEDKAHRITVGSEPLRVALPMGSGE